MSVPGISPFGNYMLPTSIGLCNDKKDKKADEKKDKNDKKCGDDEDSKSSSQSPALGQAAMAGMDPAAAMAGAIPGAIPGAMPVAGPMSAAQPPVLNQAGMPDAFINSGLPMPAQAVPTTNGFGNANDLASQIQMMFQYVGALLQQFLGYNPLTQVAGQMAPAAGQVGIPQTSVQQVAMPTGVQAVEPDSPQAAAMMAASASPLASAFGMAENSAILPLGLSVANAANGNFGSLATNTTVGSTPSLQMKIDANGNVVAGSSAPQTGNPFAAFSPGLFSLPTVGATVPMAAGSSPSGKQLVILDDANTGHGQTVMDVTQKVLQQNGINAITPTFVQQQIDMSSYQSLDQSINTLLTDGLNRRATEITQLAQSGQVGVINLSNGLSPVELMQELGNAAASDPAIKADMEKSLGIPENSDWKQFYQAMTDRVSQELQNNPAYKEAVANYNMATRFAEFKNVAVVVAGGNSQDEVDVMRKAGINVDDELGVNLFAKSPSVIAVGATNDQGTADTADDQAAPFSSVGNEIQLTANGVNVAGNPQNEGTSYSAPQVSGLIATLQAVNPNMSVAQIRQILSQTAAKSPSLSPGQAGAGIIQWGAAIQAGLDQAKEKQGFQSQLTGAA